MTSKKFIEAFADEKLRKNFEKGGKVLRQEAIENGFKTNLIGIQTFLANCEMSTQMEQYYQLCIPYAID